MLCHSGFRQSERKLLVLCLAHFSIYRASSLELYPYLREQRQITICFQDMLTAFCDAKSVSGNQARKF